MTALSPAASISHQDRYVVPSATKPGLAYMVMVDPATLLYRCSCPDHQYRARDCKHVRAVQAIQGIQSLDRVAELPLAV